MPTVTISGPAQAFARNPRASKPISDPKTLMRFHGLVSEQSCADIFEDRVLAKLGLSGGQLRIVFDEKTSSLRIITTFRVAKRLTEEQTERLVEATKEQWSDGIGSGSFDNFHGTVLSTALAIALLNSGESKDNIGEYFVDVFPLFDDDEETTVEFSNADIEKTDLDYLLEAAEFGESQAQFVLGRQLEEGDSFEKNDRLAFVNYQKAADQGHLSALTFLGLCYQGGTGTAQDLNRAYQCFANAAKEGVPLAMHCVGDCLIEGRGVEANSAEGVKWFRRGVKLGDMGCTAQLGDCYEFGKGVSKDLHKALELYELCMEGGFDVVAPAIKRVKKQLKNSGDD
ncbi:MAG: tetratricopeptide repeat protein [Zavarzinella sp.]